MRKRWFLVGVILLLASLLVVGCGIPEEDYQALVAQRDVLLSERDVLLGERDAAKAQVASLQSDLSKAQSDLAVAQAQIQSLETAKGPAEERRAKALAYAEFIHVLMYPAFNKSGIATRFEFKDKVEWFVDMKNRDKDIGDAKISSYIKEIEQGNNVAVGRLTGYVLDMLEDTLK